MSKGKGKGPATTPEEKVAAAQEKVMSREDVEEEADGLPLPVADDKGKLIKHKRKSALPAGKVGDVAWCNYQIALATWKRERALNADDPLTKIDKKIADAEAKLAKLAEQREALKG